MNIKNINKKLIYFLILAGVGAIIYGWIYLTNPYNITIPQDHKEWDSTILPKVGGLKENDKKDLIAYLDRHNPILNPDAVIPKIPYDFSIKDAIQSNKVYMADPNIRKIIAAQKKEENNIKTIKKLTDTIFVTIISKEYNEESKELTITFGIKNKSENPVVNVEGLASLKSKDGVVLSKTKEKFDVLLKKLESTTVDKKYTETEIENFNIISFSNNDISLVFDINLIKFEDGKSLVLEE